MNAMIQNPNLLLLPKLSARNIMNTAIKGRKGGAVAVVRNRARDLNQAVSLARAAVEKLAQRVALALALADKGGRPGYRRPKSSKLVRNPAPWIRKIRVTWTHYAPYAPINPRGLYVWIEMETMNDKHFQGAFDYDPVSGKLISQGVDGFGYDPNEKAHPYLKAFFKAMLQWTMKIYNAQYAMSIANARKLQRRRRARQVRDT